MSLFAKGRVPVYSGRCEKCDLSVTFEVERKFWDEVHGEWAQEGFTPDE